MSKNRVHSRNEGNVTVTIQAVTVGKDELTEATKGPGCAPGEFCLYLMGDRKPLKDLKYSELWEMPQQSSDQTRGSSYMQKGHLVGQDNDVVEGEWLSEREYIRTGI